MKLAYWMYCAPAHIGTLRIASSFKNVHAIMHAPLGDDYFNVMRSMLERSKNFTPVTTSIVDRHVLARGSQEKVVQNIVRKFEEENPDLIILTPTCTSSILQEDLKNFVDQATLRTKSNVLLADVNHYRVNELEAADQTLKQIISFYLEKDKNYLSIEKTKNPSVNIIGPTTLGFHNVHDLIELKKLFSDLSININLIIPNEISVSEIRLIPQAWFNVIPYREIGLKTAELLENKFNMPKISINPIGLLEISKFVKNIERILNEKGYFKNFDNYINQQTSFNSQAKWFSNSVDCQNLKGKEAVVFGDSTHASAITKILVNEMKVKVLWAGTYCKNDELWFNNELKDLVEDIYVTDDNNLIANLIKKSQPSAIFGTQMERHIGKRLNIPCAVISAPIHIQNFPIGYKPFIGYEGANQIADLIYNSFTLGMEDHLIEIFGGHDTKEILDEEEFIKWSTDALVELKKIPGFVRNKIKRNTEKYASTKNIDFITLEVMYSAKEEKSLQ